MERIGKKLRILRDLYGYSQDSVATTLGINQKTYSRLENDEIPLSLDRAAQLADFFHMGRLNLYKFLETDEKVFIQKIADTNGVYNTNGSVMQNQGFSEKEKEILFQQIDNLQKMVQYLMGENEKLKSKNAS